MTEPSPAGESLASQPSSSVDPSSASTSQPPTTCAQCNKVLEDASTSPPKQCLRCHSMSYCSKECQKANFKAHKKVCASLAQEYSKTHEPKMASRAPAKVGSGGSRAIQKWEYDT